MKPSKGYILGTLGKIAGNIKEKFTESAICGFLCGSSTLNDSIDSSATVNLTGIVKEKLSKKKKGKKTKEKTLPGRKPLKRAEERVGAVDAADLPKSFGYVFGGAVRESKIIALMDGLWSSICNTQASLIGALLLLTGISSFAVSLIKHIVKVSTDADTFSLCLSLVMFVIAIMLISAGSKSIYELFTQSTVGSEFMKNVMGMRVVEENGKEEKQRTPASSPRTFVVILFCLIICGVSLWAGLERIVAVSLIVAIVVAILKMPESGIMMLLTAFPWIGMLENSEKWLAIISLLIVFSWILKLSVGKRVYSICFIDATVGVFLLYYLFAGIFGMASATEIQSSVCYFVIGLLYFPVSGLIRSGEWINRCVKAYTVGTLIVSFAGLTQFIVRNVFLGGNIVFGITSVFKSNQSLCAYLLVGIFISLLCISQKEEHESGVSFKMTLALNLVCLVLAGSKTAYLAFALAFLVYLLIKKPKIVALLLFMIPFAAAVWIMMPEMVKDSVNVLLESTDLELRSKMYIWNCVIDKTKDHLILGIGTGITPLKEVWSDCTVYLPASLQLYNLYISVAVQTGVLGLVLLIVFLISAVQRGFFTVARSQRGTIFRDMSVSSVTAMISLLIFAMGNSLWHDPTLFLLFFFTVALVKCTKDVFIRESVFDEEGEILDIDISTQRKVQKENEILVKILRFIVKAVKKAKKNKRSAKALKSVKSANADDEPTETENGLEKVQIKEVDLCEEESAWQRK